MSGPMEEALLRFGVFSLVFVAVALAEAFRPRRALAPGRLRRWPTNLGLGLLDALVARVTVGGVAYAAAVYASQHEIGLLQATTVPTWVAAAVTFLALDLAIYLQHVAFHAVPALWRIHRVHHADVGFDATTGLRFHPVEILLSLAFKAAVVVLLGAVPWAVVAFEIVLNASSVFNHGNVELPAVVDRWLRRVIVTPDMHRVHHSTVRMERDSNFGFALSWWDRWLGTYRPEPALGQLGMEIGLPEYRSFLSLGRLLGLPLAADRPRTISSEELRDELRRPDPPLVLDVRGADEFVGELGHIEGARLMPLSELEAKPDALAAHRGRRIVTV